MRDQTPKGRLHRFPKWLCDPAIIGLSLLFSLAVIALIWYQSHQQSQLIESSAIQSATQYIKAIEEFRSLYSSEVVSTAKSQGLQISHDYADREGALPLPATLSMLLGERLAHGEGETKLYSPYPFPHRAEAGGLRDEFADDAWREINQSPERPFYRFEDINGSAVLRFARADVMRPSCIECHNTHPESPKNDWQVGDVRGILEVVVPLESSLAQAQAGRRNAGLLTVGFLAVAIASIGIVVMRFRRNAAALEKQVSERTGDLTEVHRELRKNQNYIENILGSMINSLIVVGPDGRIATVNNATCKLLGFSQKEIIGLSVDEIIVFDQEAAHVPNSDQGIVAMMTKKRVLRDIECHYKPKAGSEVSVNFSGAVMTNSAGELQGIVCVAQDNSQQKRLQLELAHAHKLESVGQLAAGIAHEINTPIQYIGDNLVFLKSAFNDVNQTFETLDELLEAAKASQVTPELVANVDQALQDIDIKYVLDEMPVAADQSLDGVERVSKIVRAMKEFAHPGGDSQTLVDVAKIIETAITVSSNEWKHVAEISRTYDPDVPQISGYPDELSQVFLNLIVNAAHAIEDQTSQKGTITVTTRQDEECVEIQIADTGKGIPPDVQAKMYDPFYTTKEVGKGTGQGLAIARSVVVDKHAGTITCKSDVGVGTRFVIRLPIDGTHGDGVSSESRVLMHSE
ncbi:MAG: ATP-binding protein [Pirellulales bacterium]|nr:ATP-binding protein [Pirellulales bacterium]